MRRPNYGIPPDSKLGVPVAQMDDEPQRCISINAEWLPYLEGIVRDLADDRRYDLTTQEEHDHIFNQVQMLLQRIADAVECEVAVTYELQRVMAEHVFAQNTAGGSTVANTWTNIVWNSLSLDQTNEASMDTGVITLPAGEWLIEAEHFLWSDVVVQARLRIFIGAAWKVGTQIRVPASTGTVLRVQARMKLINPGSFSIQYFSSDALATNGLGFPLNVAGENEVYGHVICERLHQTLP